MHSSTAHNFAPNSSFDELYDLHPPTILVAEDDDELRHIISKVLQTEGYAVVEAHDGRTALRELRTRRRKDPVEAVFADLWMPCLTGLQLTQRLRDDDDWATPIILISAFVTERVRYRARELGVTDLLSKPFALDELLTLARKVAPRLDP